MRDQRRWTPEYVEGHINGMRYLLNVFYASRTVREAAYRDLDRQITVNGRAALAAARAQQQAQTNEGWERIVERWSASRASRSTTRGRR